MLNMIAGSVLPITAFIGVFFAFYLEFLCLGRQA